MGKTEELVPIIRKDGDTVRIESFEPRDRAHRKMIHPTTLIIPILVEDGSRILTVNKHSKNEKKALVKGRIYAGPAKSIDILGGHITKDDLKEADRTSGMICPETIRACALRELGEELRFKGGEMTILPGDILFVGEYPYEGGGNVEISYLFALKLQGTADDYQGADDYIDPAGIKQNISLPMAAFRLQDLYAMLTNPMDHAKEYEICDGLSRLFGSGPDGVQAFVSKLSAVTGLDMAFRY